LRSRFSRFEVCSLSRRLGLTFRLASGMLYPCCQIPPPCRSRSRPSTFEPSLFNPIRCIFNLPIGCRGSCIHSIFRSFLLACAVSPLRIRPIFFHQFSVSRSAPLPSLRLHPCSFLVIYLPQSFFFRNTSLEGPYLR
jgi:hypothetical protein